MIKKIVIWPALNTQIYNIEIESRTWCTTAEPKQSSCSTIDNISFISACGKDQEFKTLNLVQAQSYEF